MSKGRLEAFSDGVIAIIITIMVLELKVPAGGTLEALRPLLSTFLTYAMSFVFVGIYWNNHHHLLHATTRINGGVLWANLHLLFWLSLTPFVTGWMGENHFQPLPVAVYGVVLLMSAIAYFILVRAIYAAEGPGSKLQAALGSDLKGKISGLVYLVAIPLAFQHPRMALGLVAFVSVIWITPTVGIKPREEHPPNSP